VQPSTRREIIMSHNVVCPSTPAGVDNNSEAVYTRGILSYVHRWNTDSVCAARLCAVLQPWTVRLIALSSVSIGLCCSTSRLDSMLALAMLTLCT
jgi:hypothetical protein